MLTRGGDGLVARRELYAVTALLDTLRWLESLSSRGLPMAESGESSGGLGSPATPAKRKARELIPEPPPPISQVDPIAFLTRLLGKTPSEILSRISSGDPLGLQAICMLRLRDQALLIDPDRLFERALAWVAVSASRAQADELIPEWLLSQVDFAIARILGEDREQELQAAGSPPEDDKQYRFIHQAFATERGLVRSAAVNFNRLHLAARRGFFRLLVDGIPVDECVHELGTTREALRADILDALRALGHLQPGEVIGSRQPKKRKRS